MMHNQYRTEPAWPGAKFIKGRLEGPPATARRLRPHEAGAANLTGTSIEEIIPDYSIIEPVDYRRPVNNAYFGDGVPKRSFCEVPALERQQTGRLAGRYLNHGAAVFVEIQEPHDIT